MTSQLARLDVRDLPGVFAARQLGRGLAASLTLERQDQIRVATALSEIGRSAVTAGLTAVIAFGVDDTDLLLTVTLDGEPPAEGIAAAARLMDQVAADGHVVRMTKRRRRAYGRTCGWSVSRWRPCARSPPPMSCDARTPI
jgi:anti-sigma regulatory factor (Ser/Thr protein kinase)